MTFIRGFFNVPGRNSDGSQTLLFRCPGCNVIHGPVIGPGSGPRWTFNGDYEKPVFSPSLLVMWPTLSKELREDGFPIVERVNRCHSFIGSNVAQPGQIVFLSDCTHPHANRVMNLIPFSWE